MKKINVRSPYYIVADNVLPPADAPNETGAYFIMNTISVLYGETLPTTESGLLAYVCEKCQYGWTDGRKMEGGTQDDCVDPPCYEDKTEVTYKVKQIPMEVGDKLYNNVDAPSHQTGVSSVFASNTIEQYSTYTQGKDPAVCNASSGNGVGFRYRFYYIYTIASGVVTKVTKVNLDCPEYPPLTTTQINAQCGKTYEIGSFTGTINFTLDTFQVTSSADPLEIKITNGGDVPVTFSAQWVKSGSSAVSSKYIGSNSYYSELVNDMGISASLVDLAASSTKATKTLTLTDKNLPHPSRVNITAFTPFVNDYFDITFDCPNPPVIPPSDSSYPLEFDSNTYVNLITGNDSNFYTGSAGSLYDAVNTTGDHLRAALLSYYGGSLTTYANRVLIHYNSRITGGSGSFNGQQSFVYPFLEDVWRNHNSSISLNPANATGGVKVINIVFVNSAEGYYYNTNGEYCNVTDQYEYDINQIHMMYGQADYGRMNAYVVNIPSISGASDIPYGGRFLPNFMKLAKQGYYSNTSGECNGAYKTELNTKGNYRYTNSVSYGGTTESPRILYDTSNTSVYKNISATNLTYKVIDYINALGFRDSSGNEIAGGTP
tara:strand:+ start:9405 stop:11207 length:1803 start_codon:yes stop_codon:yes gene_type:complete